MAKHINKILIVLVVLACACLFFPIKNLTSEAVAIDGVSGNKIVFVGLTGKTPFHYFVDDNDKSTLINATTKDTAKKYYSIVPSGRGDSSGYGEFMPTNDMYSFIEKGILYATASAQVVCGNGTQMTLTISAGEHQQQIIGTGNLSTPMLKIENISDILKISFNATSPSGRCDYVMDEPTIHLYTIIDSVTLNTENQTVSPGQLVKIDAYNDVTSMSGPSGNFKSFSKINHQIEFLFKAEDSTEFVTSLDYVEVVGYNLYILPTAPSTTVTFKVRCKKNSFSDEKIESTNTVTLTIATEKVNVQVLTDFKTSPPAKFVGEGSYGVGKGLNLIQRPNADFKFVGWYVDGEYKGNSNTLHLNATFGQQIYAKYIKSISVESITVASKKYDGTTSIDLENVLVKFSGIEPGHDVGLAGVTYAYDSPNAKKNNTITPTVSSLTLTGENADIYTLKTQVLPSITGEILKRDAYITPEANQKEYGYGDPNFAFTASNLVANESLSGGISREEGEAISKYNFTLGDLNDKNPNYTFTLINNGAQFEITQRTLFLTNVSVSEKVYDGTTSARITAELNNVFNNEDVSVQIVGNYNDKNVGNNKQVTLVSTNLIGRDKNNYVLSKYTETLYGSISPRPVTVKAENYTCVYGDKITLTYTANLLAGDTLDGELAIDNTNAGNHEIKLGTLNNPNYEISFESATCTIKKRTAKVVADAQTKPYGESDPELTYSATNLVIGDSFSGELKREGGEDVGSYKINVGNLYNQNYEIDFKENYLEIKKRKIDALITFLNKVYDGTKNVEYSVTYIENIKNENFELEVSAELSDSNCGIVDVNLKSSQVVGNNWGNYQFTYLPQNTQIEISKRTANVFVDSSSKTYGDVDPAFSYTTTGLVGDDVLDITISRVAGEDVNKYEFYLPDQEAANIRNYKIELAEGFFEIVPKVIRLSIATQSKTFGDPNPKIEFSLMDELCFNDTAESILTGKITREVGERVAIYEYIVSTVSNSKNYTFVNGEDSHFLINKRPVTVIISDATKVYGSEDPTYEYEVENDIEGERLSAQIVRNLGENVGSYTLMCNTEQDSPYIITYKSANLIITPYHLSIGAENKVKIYGNEDPAFSIAITSGYLKNNDRLENIVSGTLIRDEGEEANMFYTIRANDISLGNNYIIDEFKTGTLEIIKRNITIAANYTTKTYGEPDPEIKYTLIDSSLAFNDAIQGVLSRKPGANVDSYEITLGSISLNDNYNINFISNTFEITQKQIEIVPISAYKFYGELDAEIKYTIVGNLIDGDTLQGNLYRDKDNSLIEKAGKYKIHCDLSNHNYDIVFGEWYFEIKPREIEITADSYEITYGETEPKLTYKVTAGEILNGDKIQGTLTKKAGINAGVYDIVSTLYLGRNYSINYIKGTVTIKPKELVIKTTNYTKTYGQPDPNFNYTIVEGTLINNDILYGAVSREKGEDVGSYNLVASVYNANYHVTLQPATLTIQKKDVYMVTGVYNKVFDGTTVAYLKNPYISGIIDDVYLSYARDNSAEFASSSVGVNIPVSVHDITIVGMGAQNYNLILPNNLTADITLKEIVNHNVSVSAKDPVLYEDCALNVSLENVMQNTKIQNHNVVLKYNIWIEGGSEGGELDSVYTIKFDVPNKISSRNNIYVYQKLEDGNLLLIQCQKLANGSLVVTSSNLGEFYITVEDETWLDYATYISLNIIAILLIIICFVVIVKYRNKNKK